MVARRVVIAKVAVPNGPEDFETLENVALSVGPDARSFQTIFIGDKLLFVKMDRIWEVEFDEDSVPYKSLLAGAREGVRLNAIQMKTMLEQARRAWEDDGKV